MKPLTIEELKALKVGDWVWIEYNKTGKGYFRVGEGNIGNSFHFYEGAIGAICSYDTYGTKWLAYKNKEQAEAKGEIVELPCLRNIPSLRYDGKQVKLKELDYLNEGRIIPVIYAEGRFEEAERRLAELKGEKV